MSAIFDKTGREIMCGDILKVYHFISAHRRKKYFMFKQVVGTAVLGIDRPSIYFRLSHLDLGDGYYFQKIDGRHLTDYEIVQSANAPHFEDRPRRKRPHDAEPVGPIFDRYPRASNGGNK